jgi:hypothetical protein
MTLPRTSPTKATIGVAIVSAGIGRHLKVSDRRPAPTKATPPSANAGKVYVFQTTHTQRPKNLVKFSGDVCYANVGIFISDSLRVLTA